jgi:hypothetical protein
MGHIGAPLEVAAGIEAAVIFYITWAVLVIPRSQG